MKESEQYFTILNIMKFEERKGWRELVKAFIAEFRETEVRRHVQFNFSNKVSRFVWYSDQACSRMRSASYVR